MVLLTVPISALVLMGWTFLVVVVPGLVVVAPGVVCVHGGGWDGHDKRVGQEGWDD